MGEFVRLYHANVEPDGAINVIEKVLREIDMSKTTFTPILIQKILTIGPFQEHSKLPQF